jgi:hypothetical protein
MGLNRVPRGSVPALAGIGLLALAILSFYPNFKVRNWIPVQAEVISAQTQRYPVNTQYSGTVAGTSSVVSYSYSVNGSRYSGRIGYSGRMLTRDALSGNSTIEVRYNPVKPEASAIRRPFLSILGVFLAAFGVILVASPAFSAWLKKKESDRYRSRRPSK